MDEAEIQRQFGALLAHLPEAPRHFNLYFREATSDLTDESRAILPDILTAVKARKVPEVTVISYTDTTGSIASNYQLGLQRAQSVRALLLKAGLDASLVDVESHGEADLLQRTRDNTPSPATAASRSRSGDEAVADDTQSLTPRAGASCCSAAWPRRSSPWRWSFSGLISSPTSIAAPTTRCSARFRRSHRRPRGHRRRRRTQPDDDRPVAVAPRSRSRTDRTAARSGRRRRSRSTSSSPKPIATTDAKRPSTGRSARGDARGGRVILGYALTFDAAKLARARASIIRSALPSFGGRTKPAATRSSTPRAPSATCRASRRPPASQVFSTPRPIPTAFSGACRCSWSTDGRIYPAWRSPRSRRRPAHAAARSAWPTSTTRHRSLELHRRPGSCRSTARAICSCAIAAEANFPYVSAVDVLEGQASRRASTGRSSSWARRRSARAKSWRRRSTRCSPASKCRRPSPTTCCSRTSSRGPSTRRRSRRARARARRRRGAAGRDSARRAALLADSASRCCCGSRRCGGTAVGETASFSRRSTRRSALGLSARRDDRSRSLVVERRRADRAGASEPASQRLMVQTLLSLIEVRDAETGRHSRRTQQYTRRPRRGARQPSGVPRLPDAANASSCSPAWRRCTTSARSACPTTS